jgi:type I restriction enzyme S subunit
MSTYPKAKLGDVIDLFDNRRVPLNSQQRQERPGPYPYYGAQGIIDYIDDYIFDGQYVLVAEDGENLMSKKLPLALLASGKFWVNNHAHILRGKSGVLNDIFLLACLNNAEIKPFVTGAAQPKLSQANLRLIEIPLPSIPIQRHIAGILSAYDDLIENCQRRIQILEEMARSLYREWFVNFRYPGHESVPLVPSALGEIPQGWEVKKLADLCARMESGGTPKRSTTEYWEGGDIDWYKTGELWDGFLFESQEKITTRGHRESTARLFEPGTVLMAIYGSPTVGRMGILTTHGSCNQAALGLVADNNLISQTFLYFVLYSLRDYFNGIAQGAAQQNISKEKVAGAIAIVPPKRTVQAFDDCALPIFSQIKTLQQKARNLRQTRDLLLPRLMSGQLEVTVD